MCIGYFFVDKVAKMQNHVLPTNHAGSNGWAMPASHKNIDVLMDFPDWLFSAQEHHALIQQGLEGVDFERSWNGTHKPWHPGPRHQSSRCVPPFVHTVKWGAFFEAGGAFIAPPDREPCPSSIVNFPANMPPKGLTSANNFIIITTVCLHDQATFISI